MFIFFNMIVNGITLVLTFFGKWTFFSNSASALSNVRFLTRKVLFVALIILFIVYIGLEIAFYYFMIDSIIHVYNLISALLIKMQTMQSGNGSESPILQPLFLLLHSTGVASAFNSVFPFIASALIFRIMKVLYVAINHLHTRLLYLYLESIKLITAA